VTPLPNLLPQTPSQTVGPFFAFALTGADYGSQFPQLAYGRIARDDTPGTRIRIVGRVFDGAGQPIPDAMIEVWQADAAGRYASPADFVNPAAFHGFGRIGTGSSPDASFRIETIKPGGHGSEAPHLNLIVFMRGLLLHAFTRLYFSDETAANAACLVLTLVPPERRATLIAEREKDGTYRFDIHMQGENETVFFDV
jgi:protocatechuate 3,4-dioxygenase alpha subunit